MLLLGISARIPNQSNTTKKKRTHSHTHGQTHQRTGVSYKTHGRITPTHELANARTSTPQSTNDQKKKKKRTDLESKRNARLVLLLRRSIGRFADFFAGQVPSRRRRRLASRTGRDGLLLGALGGGRPDGSSLVHGAFLFFFVIADVTADATQGTCGGTLAFAFVVSTVLLVLILLRLAVGEKRNVRFAVGTKKIIIIK